MQYYNPFLIFPNKSRKKLQDCEPGAAKPGNGVRDSEKFYNGDYDCYRNHDHERAKDACEYRLNNESEKTVCLHNGPSGFAVHHVLCFGTIVVHNSLSFSGSLLLVVFLVFLDVGYLLRICFHDKDNTQNNPEDGTSGIMTGSECTECADRPEDDRDNSKLFHNSMTLSIKLHYCVQSLMS